MQATRSCRYTEVMPSPASQLLQWTVPALDFDLAFALQHSSRPVVWGGSRYGTGRKSVG
nr:MAG TPA: hypothetical protein [Caudoviricetes sp.]